MTIREVVDRVGLDDPLMALTAAVAVLRTAVQGEAATAEGCWATVMGFERRYGAVTAETVELWLDDLGDITDAPVPRQVLEMTVSAAD